MAEFDATIALDRKLAEALHGKGQGLSVLDREAEGAAALERMEQLLAPAAGKPST